MPKNVPNRKQIRLKEYDYSKEGYYFITICTKDRKQILSKIKTNEIANNIINTKQKQRKKYCKCCRGGRPSPPGKQKQ